MTLTVPDILRNSAHQNLITSCCCFVRSFKLWFWKSKTKVCAPTLHLSKFVDHLYDYRPNVTPLSPITIINWQGSKERIILNILSWQMKVLRPCRSARYILCVVQGDFFKNLSLEPCMDVLGQTLIQVIDSTVHYNTEYKRKVHLCLTLLKHFFNAYSQITFT